MGIRRLWDRLGRREQVAAPAPVPAGPPLRVAIYAREDRDEQGKVLAAVEDQLALTRAYVARRGWQVVSIFSDPATEPEATRAGFQALRAGIWRRRFDVVVSSSPDRLYFDVERLARLAREARLLDVELVFVQAPRDLDLFSDPQEF